MPDLLRGTAPQRSTWSTLLALLPGYDCFRGVPDGWFFDCAAADKACDFFPACLQFVEGERAGKPFELEPWQRAIVGAIFGWMRDDGTRRYREAFVYVPRKNGKALALDTPIPTPSGWTTMGEVADGDVIFDELGRPCRVINATEIMYGRQCYRVQFSDGTSIVADAEHQWLTRTRATEGRAAVTTTERIAATLLYGNRPGVNERNHSIAAPGPLHTPVADLPLDPYVLGAWLGDGTSCNATLTCHEDDLAIVETIAARGVATRIKDYGRGASGKVRLVQLGNGRRGYNRGDSLKAPLRALGVLGNKHIPRIYLRASRDQRMELLRGLMDTDGYASAAGQCELTTVSERMASDALELIRSLGLKPSMTVHRAKIYGRDCGAKYRIQFWAYTDWPCFHLERKRARLKPPPAKPTRARTLTITAVEPVASVPVRCIEVDSPSHLFLAGPGMTPTHNSSFVAGVLLRVLFTDGEPGAQIYSAAADRDQAALIFRHAKAMVERSRFMAANSKVYQTYKSIEFPRTNSVYRALSSEAATKHGLSTHFAVVDELHAHKNRELFDVINTSTGARRQPIMFTITTADYNRESICNEKYDYASKVRDGILSDPAFLPVLYEAARDADWKDPAVWAKANPNLGVSVSREYLERECKRAQESAAYLNTFLRLHLNVRTDADVAWLSMDAWDKGSEPIDPESLRGRPCYLGLDLSTKTDVTALAALFPPVAEDEPWKALLRFWVPKDNAHRREHRDRVPYATWARQGHIDLTDGDVIDYDFIHAAIVDACARYEVRDVGFDPWNATQTANYLQAQGVTCTEVRQGIQSLGEATKELERLVIGGEIQHGGNPVLRWMASNTMVLMDSNGNMKVNKGKSTGRIDGICALLNALARAIAKGENGPSVYETRGIVTL